MTGLVNTPRGARPDPYAQQKLLAEFGSYALSAGDLDMLLKTACRMAAEGSGQTLSKIVEHRDGELVVVASHGYNLQPDDMVLGQAGGTSAGHALETGTPTVSNDVLADGRFERATIEAGGEVRSVLNVPIPELLDEEVAWYGVIEVDSPDIGAFDEDQVAFLRLYAELIGAAIERHRTQSRLEALVAEKARLLDELQHRVKNNLAIITGLIRMQSRKVSVPDTQTHLTAIERRIETLRLLHDTLYGQRSSDRVALDTYLDTIAKNLAALNAPDAGPDRIVIETSIEAYVVAVDRAIPLGLIINEFLTNSLKYAFSDRGGRIDISLRKLGDEAEMILTDDGPGLPEGAEAAGGTGMLLIRGLAGQIGAHVAWKGTEGTMLKLRFPLPDLGTVS